MDIKSKKLINSHIIDYLKILNPNLVINKRGLFECPFKHEHKKENNEPSCNIFPPNSHKLHCFDPAHGSLGNIFDIFKKAEKDMINLSEEEIAEYLVNLLDIKIDDKINKLLIDYQKLSWYLFPLQPKSKNPVAGTSWKKASTDDLQQWLEWIECKLGLGLYLGKKSNTIAIDIDDPKTFKKIKHLMGDTLTQITKRGYHYCYNYDEDFDNINHANLRNKGYEMEVRANNSYIAIAPSFIEEKNRYWNDKKKIDMPKELKEFLLGLIDKKVEKKEDNEIQKAIDEEKIEINGIIGEGQRDTKLTQIGGILRKQVDKDKTLSILHTVINKNFCKPPLSFNQVKKIVNSLDKYTTFDKKEMAKELLIHLEKLEQANARDLKDSLKYEKKDIEDILDYLIKEGKVKKYGRNYEVIKKTEWQTDFMSIGKPLKITVPYFDKYARFEAGTMIILGASSGHGKTHCATNLLKLFVDQKINPYYICAEAGSKFGKISATLGLKVGDYSFKLTGDPASVELEDNAVTIIDWLKPKNSEYSKTDTIYEKLNDQLLKHQGLLIVFAQLRRTGEFFAPDMIDFYASLVAKYCHSPIKNDKGTIINWDTENTYFKTEKIRDSKIGQQYITIPMHFNKETKILSLREK